MDDLQDYGQPERGKPGKWVWIGGGAFLAAVAFAAGATLIASGSAEEPVAGDSATAGNAATAVAEGLSGSLREDGSLKTQIQLPTEHSGANITVLPKPGGFCVVGYDPKERVTAVYDSATGGVLPAGSYCSLPENDLPTIVDLTYYGYWGLLAAPLTALQSVGVQGDHELTKTPSVWVSQNHEYGQQLAIVDQRIADMKRKTWLDSDDSDLKPLETAHGACATDPEFSEAMQSYQKIVTQGSSVDPTELNRVLSDVVNSCSNELLNPPT